MYAFLERAEWYISDLLSLFLKYQPFSFLYKIFLNCTYSAFSHSLSFSTGIALFYFLFTRHRIYHLGITAWLQIVTIVTGCVRVQSPSPC